MRQFLSTRNSIGIRDGSPIEALASAGPVAAALLFVFVLIGGTGLAVWDIENGSVNVIYSDTFGHLGMIKHFLSGQLSLDEVFLPHNQNRPVLLNLVLLISAKYDHLNLKRIEYLGIFFAVLTLALMLYFSKDLFKARRAAFFLVFSCIAALALSLSQWDNFLLAIDFVFFSTITFSVGSVLLMARHLGRAMSRIRSTDFIAAILLSELAMYSMGGGVMIWAVNLIQIALSGALHRRRIRSEIVVYGVIGLVSVAAYVHNLSSLGSFAFVFRHHVEFLQFMLSGLANSVVTHDVPRLGADMAIGLVLVVVFGVALAEYFKLSLAEQQQALGLLCLVLLGIAEELLIAVGRLPLGVTWAAGSHYATLTMVTPAASLILLAFYANRSRVYALLAVLLGLTMCISAAVADYSEVVTAKYRKQYGENLQRILLQGEIDEYGMRELQFHPLSSIEDGVRILKQFHLNVFRN